MDRIGAQRETQVEALRQLLGIEHEVTVAEKFDEIGDHRCDAAQRWLRLRKPNVGLQANAFDAQVFQAQIVINDQLVVEKILKHLDLWQPQAHSPSVREETRMVEEAI